MIGLPLVVEPPLGLPLGASGPDSCGPEFLEELREDSPVFIPAVVAAAGLDRGSHPTVWLVASDGGRVHCTVLGSERRVVETICGSSKRGRGRGHTMVCIHSLSEEGPRPEMANFRFLQRSCLTLSELLQPYVYIFILYLILGNKAGQATGYSMGEHIPRDHNPA